MRKHHIDTVNRPRRMMRMVVTAALAACLTACAGYYEGSANRTPGEVADDVAIQGSVKTALLREPGIEGLAIDTEVRRGVVTLYGRVASEALRQRAVDLVKSISGVVGVADRLVVVP